MTISIVMATYNGEKYIRTQLDSLLTAMAPGDELIISDDGSTDGTVSIVREYEAREGRIRLVKGPGAGVIRNFDAAFSLAKCDLIMPCDQDDLWLPEKLPTIRSVFEKDPDLLLACHDLYMADDDAILRKDWHVRMTDNRRFVHGVSRNVLKSAYYGCGMTWRRELNRLALPIPEGVPMYDQWIACLGESTGKCLYLDQALIVHRMHGDNWSQTLPLWGKISVRLKMLRHLIPRLVCSRRIAREISK